MVIRELGLEGVIQITPPRFEDARGYFSECWNAGVLAEHGITLPFVQDNQSYIRATGTVRGLHYQSPPHAQDKLVRVVQGAILDVRVGSPNFGRWVGAVDPGGRDMPLPAGRRRSRAA